MMLCLLFSGFLSAKFYISEQIEPKLTKEKKELKKVKHHHTAYKKLMPLSKSKNAEVQILRTQIETMKNKLKTAKQKTQSMKSDLVESGDAVALSRLREEIVKLCELSGIVLDEFSNESNRNFKLTGYAFYNNVLQFVSALNLLQHTAVVDVFELSASKYEPGKVKLSMNIEI